MPLALKEIHPSAHASERQLVRAVRAGDDRAFEQLFERYRRRISAYVYSLLSDHGRAEDITQEVFISALRRLRETERPISFKPWIYEIARNACIDEFRRVSRASLVSLDTGPEHDGFGAPQLADLATPEVRLERKQQIGDLFGAFSSLTDNQHKILVLRELEGLSYGEIGARMGMSRPMVESTLFRARRRLTQEYDELASGRRCLEVQTAVDEQQARGLASLGLRERRRIARHLHHCPECLRHARMAGIDDSALRVPGSARRVAALLPFGWIRIAWHRARLGGRTGAARAAQRASALGDGTPQSVAAGRAAAAVVAILATGGGITALAQHHRQPARQAVHTSAPAWSPASAISAVGQVPFLVTPHTTSTGAAATAAARSASAASGLRSTRRHGSRAGSKAATRSRTVAPASSGSGPRVASRPSGQASPVPLPIPTPLGTVVSKGAGTVGTVINKVTGVVNSLPTTITTVTSSQPPGTVPVPNPGAVLPGTTVPSVTVPGTGIKTPSVSVPAGSDVSVPAGSEISLPRVTVPGAGGLSSPNVTMGGGGTTATGAGGITVPLHLP